MTRNKSFAPAKINLTLHVTGRRDDGYHLVDSLVAFADFGDVVSVAPAPETRLTVTGPKSRGVPTDDSNLVVRAARLLGITADIHLEKHLPAAAGIGGGSSDAAAVVRALCDMTGIALTAPSELLELGADVPVCLSPGLSRMRGIGDQLDPLPQRTPMPMVLINPGVDVPTGPVFSALSSRDNAPMSWPMPRDDTDWVAWLMQQRNDLQPPAQHIAPVIGDVLGALQVQPGCLLARMSGSGATCFALMDSVNTRENAAAALRATHPDWWVQGCMVS